MSSLDHGCRVRDVRERMRMPQQALARAAGISRQALSAIEAGRAVPSVAAALRIAAVLDTSVELLFGSPTAATAPLIAADVARGAGPGSPVVVARVGGKLVAHACAGDALAAPCDGVVVPRGRVALCRPAAELEGTILLAGCAPALGGLAARAERALGTPVRWLGRSSRDALRLVRERRVHVGGAHFGSNEAAVRKALPGRRTHIVALAAWEAGLVVPHGNPLSIRRVDDLARKKLRIAWREPGSGARALLERLLAAAGLDRDDVGARAIEVKSHADAARAVALGFADVGFSMRAAAQAFSLDLVPLAVERFDLVAGDDAAADPRVARILDLVTDNGFRRELVARGYETVT